MVNDFAPKNTEHKSVYRVWTTLKSLGDLVAPFLERCVRAREVSVVGLWGSENGLALGLENTKTNHVRDAEALGSYRSHHT